MQRIFPTLLLLVAVSVSFVPAIAADGNTQLVVGIKQAPPFVIRDAEGTYGGITVALFEQAAADMGLAYEYVETDLNGMLDGLTSGEYDVGLGALTITAERERQFDFSHAFFTSGLGIAVHQEDTRGWLGVAEHLVSWAFLRIVALLVLVILAIGVLVWLFERRRNTEQFGGSAAQGIGSGFWWSAVTMTTVGYGDKAPRTFWGRILGFVWMFAGLLLVASFTASITSLLTVAELESRIGGPSDLKRLTVASVSGSTSEDYLGREGIRIAGKPQLGDCLQALAEHRADAVVYDAPILQYWVNRDYGSDLVVLPVRFERQDYGIGLPEASPYREGLNQAMLRVIEQPSWQQTLQRFLGSSQGSWDSQ